MESVTSNKDYLNLDGRIVLITGARGQLGRELTKTFLSMGSIVVATDILDSNEYNPQENGVISFTKFMEIFMI